jgi:hypothetical protein
MLGGSIEQGIGGGTALVRKCWYVALQPVAARFTGWTGDPGGYVRRC